MDNKILINCYFLIGFILFIVAYISSFYDKKYKYGICWHLSMFFLLTFTWIVSIPLIYSVNRYFAKKNENSKKCT